jgi:phosphohistidine phosphatase SixA
MSTRPLAVLLVLWLFGAPSPARAQKAIFLVRHAEKQRPDNERDNPLSPAGIRRSAALANALRDAGVTTVYTSSFNRTKQTAAPLVQMLRGANPKFEPTEVPDGEPVPRTVERLLRHPTEGSVLIVTHSGEIPDYLRALKVQPPPDRGLVAELQDRGEFDNLFVVIPQVVAQPDGTKAFKSSALIRLRYGE